MPLTPTHKVWFNIVGLARCIAPHALYSISREISKLSADELCQAELRAQYYCRKPLRNAPTEILASEFRFPRRKPRHTNYFYPLRHLLNYFPQNLRFNYFFGDVYGDCDLPTLIKARPIGSVNCTLLPLNAIRHFRYVVNDTLNWDEKKPQLVSRNVVSRQARILLLDRWFGNERMDLGQVNTNGGCPELWLRPRLSVDEQLRYKFIACIEGNDVATNLKWVMSSNSLPVMPKPTMETWFMEGTLLPGENYVAVRSDYADLLDKMDYYLSHPAEAREMIENNHEYIRRFRNPQVELVSALLTLQRYFD